MLSVLIAILLLAALSLGFGLLLGYSSIRFQVEENPLADKIAALLPQSQCGQCGFPGCGPYAEAVASGAAPINGCPPGGEATMVSIAELLGIDPVPMGGEEGECEKPKMVAYIDEQACIGCAVCLKQCPVDAILGTTRQMHTIIADECIGCEACVEPCPVDCISMRPIKTDLTTWAWPLPGPGKPSEIAMPAG
jgi:electron transport complex protein RnfB